VTYTDEQLARVAHGTIAALQYVQGDNTPSVPWDSMPDEQRQAAVYGVTQVRAGKTPAQLHEIWVARMKAAGWSYGAAKDTEAKTHPNMCSYDQLPGPQRDKDTAFAAVVRALSQAPA
jgi:RyR domain